MPNTETQIYNGRVVDLLNPKPGDVSIEHIAKVLSRQYRFNGNTRLPITVAEHCLTVSNYIKPDLAIYGLLHDAHEAFFGDISTPLKMAIKQLTGTDATNIIAEKWDSVIYPAFGLPVPNETEHAHIKAADIEALHEEASNLMWQWDGQWSYFPNQRYKPMGEKKAHTKFMERFTSLMEEREWI